MVKANELRIGNWVYGFKTEWSIQEQDFRMLDTDTNQLPYDPIPVTQKWLEGLGFEDGKLLLHLDVHMQVDIGSEGAMVYLMRIPAPEDFISYGVIAASIKYVHQLQNIYFSLTEKELTFKEYDTNKNTTQAN